MAIVRGATVLAFEPRIAGGFSSSGASFARWKPRSVALSMMSQRLSLEAMDANAPFTERAVADMTV